LYHRTSIESVSLAPRSNSCCIRYILPAQVARVRGVTPFWTRGKYCRRLWVCVDTDWSLWQQHRTLG